MDGMSEKDREAQRREPSPLVGEVEERLRDIVQNGAEPWNDRAEERRATRRRDMELLRLSVMEAALHTTEYICGRLPNWKREPFEKITDPVASLANLTRAIVQITLAEDRFDETVEDRAARIKTEAEARMRAEQDALAERNYTARQIRKADNRRQVQNSVRAITLDYIKLPFDEREKLFADLFRQLEADDAYDGDPAETVANVVARFGIVPRIVPDVEIKAPDGKIDLVARKARLLAFARTYLDLMRPAGPADPSAPPARAQGPPH